MMCEGKCFSFRSRYCLDYCPFDDEDFQFGNPCDDCVHHGISRDKGACEDCIYRETCPDSWGAGA